MSATTSSAGKFNILSIDGGGIRGIHAAKILAEFENYLQKNSERKSLWEHFDLITGTSTGGIIAIALALGIPATEILEMYQTKASTIFGNKKGIIRSLFYAAHDRADLANIIRTLFKTYHDHADPLIGQCKTNIAVPIYDLNNGTPRVLKTQYNSLLTRDHQMPAYMAALATSAAPTFFDPYSTRYINSKKQPVDFFHIVDGGVFANNPSLGCLIEVQDSFNVKLEDISMLSIGSGHTLKYDPVLRENYGIIYWMQKKRIIETFLQAQAQEVENLISIMKNGIGKAKPDRFHYLRLNFEMVPRSQVELDETRARQLLYLAEQGLATWNTNAEKIKQFAR